MIVLKGLLILWNVAVQIQYVSSEIVETNLKFAKTLPLVKVRNASEAEAADEKYYVLDFLGLVQRHGYPAEEHIAVTEDGYNIRVHRIPGSGCSPPAPGKPVVLMQHGVLGSSDAWVLMGPSSDLPFLLADAGYDVWMGNARGNTYSRSHQTLDPSMQQFWEFSFHEIGTLDLPAMIDYILLNTNQENLYYVGHSMGTTVSYVLLSQRPEYNEKINLVICLAPVAFWRHHYGALQRFIATSGPFFEEILKNIREIFPQTRELAEWAKTICRGPKNPCKLIVSELAGRDFTLLNETNLPYIASYYPAGGSTKTLLHFQQNMRSGKFRQYDEGPHKNMELYGKRAPPPYDVTKITAPVALIYAPNDPIATRKDTRVLSKRLPNVATWEPVPYAQFNHIDFQWTDEAKPLVNDRIIQLMEMYRR